MFFNSSKCYEDIFSGNWEAYDPFRLSQGAIHKLCLNQEGMG